MTLKELRKAKGWKQKRLAKVIGISVTALSLIENGHTFPSPRTKDLLEIVLDSEFIAWKYPITEDDIHLAISKFIGMDVERAEELIEYIDRHRAVIKLNILKTKIVKK